jgi:hypothetical protein
VNRLFDKSGDLLVLDQEPIVSVQGVHGVQPVGPGGQVDQLLLLVIWEEPVRVDGHHG